MSIDYTPSTNFTAKDGMSTSNPDKVLSGVPFDVEFQAIKAAFEQATPALDPTFTGTVTADAIIANTVNGSDTANWDTAYSWGDHSTEGYLTAFSETDPVFSASEAALFVAGDKADLDTVVAWNVTHGGKTTNWDTAYTVIDDKEAIWDSKVEEVPSPVAGAQYARVDGAWAVVQAGAASSLTQEQIDGYDDASAWVSSNGSRVSQWDTAYGWGNHASAGYATDDPAIISNGSTPSLATGITAGEIRSLIGAGTSGFSGSYNDLSNKPTIPTNNNQLTNGAGYTTYTGSDAVKKTGNETIGGTKTFTSTIAGSINGNAATATTATSATSATTATTAGSATNCTRQIIAGTNLSGGGTLTANRTINLVSEPSVTSLKVSTKVDIGDNWDVELDGNDLVFEYAGSRKMRLKSNGDLVVSGNVTAYGTP